MLRKIAAVLTAILIVAAPFSGAAASGSDFIFSSATKVNGQLLQLGMPSSTPAPWSDFLSALNQRGWTVSKWLQYGISSDASASHESGLYSITWDSPNAERVYFVVLSYSLEMHMTGNAFVATTEYRLSELDAEIIQTWRENYNFGTYSGYIDISMYSAQESASFSTKAVTTLDWAILKEPGMPEYFSFPLVAPRVSSSFDESMQIMQDIYNGLFNPVDDPQQGAIAGDVSSAQGETDEILNTFSLVPDIEIGDVSFPSGNPGMSSVLSFLISLDFFVPILSFAISLWALKVILYGVG